MHKLKYLILIIVLCCFLFTGCKKKPTDEPVKPNDPVIPDNPDIPVPNFPANVNFVISFSIFDEIVETKEYKYGETVVLGVTEKEGYKFIGWSFNDIIYNDSFYINIDNIPFPNNSVEYYTFYAVYEEIDIFEPIINKIILPESTKEDLNLVTKIDDASITWRSYNSGFITSDGIISRYEQDFKTTLCATISYLGKTKEVTFDVVVLGYSSEEKFNQAVSYLESLTLTNGKYDLPLVFKTLRGTNLEGYWSSSDEGIINNEGLILNYPLTNTTVVLTLHLKVDDKLFTKEFSVIVEGIDGNERIDSAVKLAYIPTYLVDDYVLPTCFDYGVTGEWISKSSDVITNEGIVKVINKVANAVVTLKLTLEFEGQTFSEERDYNMIIDKKEALKVIYAQNFHEEGMEDVSLVGGRLVLDSNALIGTYESNEYSTIAFSSLVPTWCAISSTNATVEFLVKVCVNNVWSSYISYCPGGWGLGLKNKVTDVNAGSAKLSTDEVMCLNGNGDKVKFKLILRRNSLKDLSPSVSLVSFALKGSSYNGSVYDISQLPTYYKHVVPKLCQLVVPTIGNSICSATSTTMLLKYKGMDFKAFDSSYEHRYIAGIVRDYGNNIYGNWVYNVVTMGAYGFNAYVERMYSINELVTHLATVGPCALSVKGQMVSDKKTYNTNGHLIVAIGYQIVDGKLSIICNDPNVNEVECLYSESVMQATWRNIAYVIE